jgi:hypothetical protein
VHQRPPALRRQLAAEPPVGDRRPVVHPVGEQGVVVVGEQLDQPGGEAGVGGAVGREARAAGTQPTGRPHRDDRRGQPLGDAPQDAVGVGAAAVQLVHEQQGGDAQPLQRPHQQAGLRLHALHRGDDQHGAVEHAQDPFHLGDEVGVAGRVDQVDGDAVEHQRHHRGLDGDAALALQRQRVGLGAAVVDAADLADDTGGVEQPLGQGGLTGVYMCQDSQVQRAHEASCPLDSAYGWT